MLAALCLQAVTGLAADGGAPDAATHVDSGRPDSGATRADSGVRADGGRLIDAGGGDAALPPPTFKFGKACNADADCATGLTCLKPSSSNLGPGGPAGGVCSVDCSANGQSDCNAVDTAGLCVTFDPAGVKAYCLEGCIPGAPIQGLVKCHDRPDMACTPTQDLANAYCAPTCRGDFDCGSRKCDENTGLCTDTISGSLDTGAACDATASTNECKGGCLSLGTSTASGTADSFCTARCSLGAANSCGEAPGKTGKVTAACILTADASEGDGDIGYCEQVCDCDSDCLHPEFLCVALPSAVQEGIGRLGRCLPKDRATTHLACGAPDGGTVGPKGTSDAGPTAVDGGADGGAGAPKSSGDSGGCGCHVDGAPANGRSAALAFAALGMVALLRRRR